MLAQNVKYMLNISLNKLLHYIAGAPSDITRMLYPTYHYDYLKQIKKVNFENL